MFEGKIGRGEKMDSRLCRSVLRTALRASVVALRAPRCDSDRLGAILTLKGACGVQNAGRFVNFRPLPPEGIWAFISSCY